jgi:uncharacterized spore protein YtfJ
MADKERCAEQKPFRVETVRGEPYLVAGRRLVPVARVVSFGKARGTLGSRHISGWGAGYVRVTPVAVVEETGEGARTIPIRNLTYEAYRGMALRAGVQILLLAVIRWLARRWRAARAASDAG